VWQGREREPPSEPPKIAPKWDILPLQRRRRIVPDIEVVSKQVCFYAANQHYTTEHHPRLARKSHRQYLPPGATMPIYGAKEGKMALQKAQQSQLAALPPRGGALPTALDTIPSSSLLAV
jgi:hypothetical protein